jgi:hypothetical protein
MSVSLIPGLPNLGFEIRVDPGGPGSMVKERLQPQAMVRQ